MILLILTTRTAKGESWNPPDLVLNHGGNAPFTGVLVNPDHYKFYTIERLEAEDCKANLVKMIQPPPLIAKSDAWSFMWGVLVGGVIVGITALAVH